jgi:hypothetical protein
VIFISGYVAGGAAARDKPGEPGLLQKPVSPEQLVAVVRERCR